MKMLLASCFLVVSSPAFALTPAGPQESLLDNVPDAACAAVAVRRSAFTLVRTFLDSSPGMKQELGAYLTKHIGVDLTTIDGIAAWSTQLGPQAGGAALLHLTSPGSLKGQVHGSFDGTDLIGLGQGLTAAAVPGGILFGTEQEVRVGIAVAHKKAGGLSAKSPLGALTQIDRGADLVAGLLASGIKDAEVAALSQQYGVDLVTLVLRGSGLITLELVGDGQKLQAAQTLLNNGATVALQQLKQAKDRAVSREGGDVAEGVSAISAYYQAAALWKEFAPKLIGSKLQSQYQMPEIKTAGTLVPLLGVGAAVAIPAFMKYVRRSKTVEATMNLRKLFDSSVSYYEEHEGPGKASFTFPKSTAWTPKRSCCGQPGDKCQPDPKAWNDPTWTALSFSVDDPSYYQYRYTSVGKGKKAHFVIEARGDLDCDGQFSSFKRTGDILPDGSVTGGSGLETHDEIE
jgi:type IV pilus assembly protein PilA